MSRGQINIAKRLEHLDKACAQDEDRHKRPTADAKAKLWQLVQQVGGNCDYIITCTEEGGLHVAVEITDKGYIK
jgi:hypothetical protein